MDTRASAARTTRGARGEPPQSRSVGATRSEAGLGLPGKVLRCLLHRRPDLHEDVRGELRLLAVLPAHRSTQRGGGDVNGLLEQLPIDLTCHEERPPCDVRPDCAGEGYLTPGLSRTRARL